MIYDPCTCISHRAKEVINYLIKSAAPLIASFLRHNIELELKIKKYKHPNKRLNLEINGAVSEIMVVILVN